MFFASPSSRGDTHGGTTPLRAAGNLSHTTSHTGRNGAAADNGPISPSLALEVPHHTRRRAVDGGCLDPATGPIAQYDLVTGLAAHGRFSRRSSSRRSRPAQPDDAGCA